jgi:selenide,water dikinase
VLVDAATRDDAAVFRIAPDRALIATVDFFTPIVDDPATWGAIAATNALSDVYAMGGRPLFCLNLVGWPRETLSLDLLGEVMRGAAEVALRAGCPMVGGHSIDDLEPKFGLAVIGEVRPDQLLLNSGARPGDALVLTKPIGTGILTTALKRGRLTEADLEAAIRSMTTLNDTAARLVVAHGAHAGTDVTGFGLLGHLENILRASQVGAELVFSLIPTFPGALALAGEGMVPGGTRRNLEAVVADWDPTLGEAERLLCGDAQTSGGLLVAVPSERASGLVADLVRAGVTAAAIIGRVTADPVLRIVRDRRAG